MRQLFAGAHGAYRDIVVLNSAAALVVADHAQDIAEGLQQADQALSSGAAAKVLDQLAALTQSLAGK